MQYYSTKARKNAIENISKYQRKIANIPGNILSYTEARELQLLLHTLENYILIEDKKDTGK